MEQSSPGVVLRVPDVVLLLLQYCECPLDACWCLDGSWLELLQMHVLQSLASRESHALIETLKPREAWETLETQETQEVLEIQSETLHLQPNFCVVLYTKWFSFLEGLGLGFRVKGLGVRVWFRVGVV